MNQETPISPEEQYIGVDPHNIIRMQIEIAVEALVDIAYTNSLSKEAMIKAADDAINELEMVGDMYSYGYQD
jgi:hypothetical protein|tara:strand:- start:3117 stop:3332 length:216 start_codon:yes stop_codon:yes gene_type:complete